MERQADTGGKTQMRGNLKAKLIRGKNHPTIKTKFLNLLKKVKSCFV